MDSLERLIAETRETLLGQVADLQARMDGGFAEILLRLDRQATILDRMEHSSRVWEALERKWELK